MEESRRFQAMIFDSHHTISGDGKIPDNPPIGRFLSKLQYMITLGNVGVNSPMHVGRQAGRPSQQHVAKARCFGEGVHQQYLLPQVVVDPAGLGLQKFASIEGIRHGEN